MLPKAIFCIILTANVSPRTKNVEVDFIFMMTTLFNRTKVAQVFFSLGVTFEAKLTRKGDSQSILKLLVANFF